MSIVSSSDVYNFLELSSTGYFIINAANDVLKLAYDGGTVTDIELTDGTYSGSDLATQIATQIDSAFTISSTVTYSATTYKLTIAVATGHTIALTFSGSDAALTCGFTEDASAAVSITSDTAVPGDDNDIADMIQEMIEEWLKNTKCFRTFESTTYTNDLYDGNGMTSLFLDNWPITAISRIAITREDAIKIKNTSTDCTTAYVGISSTAINLTVSGGDNEGTDEILFADYATMTDVVDQINTLSDEGWSAELYHSDYGDIKSTELLETFAKYCGARANTTANWEYLEMAGEPIVNFKVYKNRGEIYYSGSFPEGEQNIIISHTSGYTSTTMPEDLKKGILISIKFLFSQWKEERLGVTDFSLSGFMTQKLERTELPQIALNVFDKYARKVIA